MSTLISITAKEFHSVKSRFEYNSNRLIVNNIIVFYTYDHFSNTYELLFENDDDYIEFSKLSRAYDI